MIFVIILFNSFHQYVWVHTYWLIWKRKNCTSRIYFHCIISTPAKKSKLFVFAKKITHMQYKTEYLRFQNLFFIVRWKPDKHFWFLDITPNRYVVFFLIISVWSFFKKFCSTNKFLPIIDFSAEMFKFIIQFIKSIFKLVFLYLLFLILKYTDEFEL